MAKPNLSYLKNVFLTLVGLAAGVWCGITGMAAAPLLAPLLSWLIGARGQRLGGSVLLVTFVAAVASLLAYGQAHALHWLTILPVAVATVAGSITGSLPALSKARNNKSARAFITLLIAAVGAWLISLSGSSHSAAAAAPTVSHMTLWLLAAGFAAGLVAALARLSGVLIVPALFALVHVPMVASQATSLATLALVSALPAANTVAQRQYSPHAAIWCAFGGIMGALLGSRLAVRETNAGLLLVYGAGLIVVATIGMIVHLRADGGEASAGYADGRQQAS